MDIVVSYGLLAAVILVVLVTQPGLLSIDNYLPVVLGGAALLFTITVVNVVLLPSLCGSSVGQLVTGLVWIRGADGTRPGVTDMRRAFFKHRGAFRVGGVQQFAPELVVVRRRDLAAPAPTTVTGSTGFTEH
ncbi:hypothetical protein [Nocardia sp. SSK8]|uniref:hypothetical protein n=1 Tax=Nocardia sp. SSK8 TaxID=3120154 RepID=UPI00300B4EB3